MLHAGTGGSTEAFDKAVGFRGCLLYHALRLAPGQCTVTIAHTCQGPCIVRMNNGLGAPLPFNCLSADPKQSGSMLPQDDEMASMYVKSRGVDHFNSEFGLKHGLINTLEVRYVWHGERVWTA